MGFSRQQIIHAFSEVTETSQRRDISSLWPTVLCRLREDEIYGSTSVPQSITDRHIAAPSSFQNTTGSNISLSLSKRRLSGLVVVGTHFVNHDVRSSRSIC